MKLCARSTQIFSWSLLLKLEVLKEGASLADLPLGCDLVDARGGTGF